MSDSSEFSFSDQSVADGYDQVLVPVLFEPWARQIINEHGPWEGRHVLDLATGTGIVARHLVDVLGPEGKLSAVDINSQMLDIARQHCADSDPEVNFLEASAQDLPLEDESVDFAICQQGFQFFPDRKVVATELHRVLRSGGEIYLSCWLPTSEVPMFNAICSALDEIGQTELAEKMRIPFDRMPAEDLQSSFEEAEFTNVSLTRRELDFVIPGGISFALQMPFATPIGPDLRKLPNAEQSSFQNRLKDYLMQVCNSDGVTMGKMVTHVLTAVKE